MQELRKTAGRVMLVGIPDTGLEDALARRLGRLGPAGVILFARNLDTPAQTGRLVEGLRRALGGPALVAIDQEGGRVSRLAPWVGPTPAASTLARAGARASAAFGAATAAALAALGFNVDFAPVVDLSPADAANGIGDRSFGEDAAAVTRCAGAFLRALQAGGVAGCLKHFPGLGDTAVDSHVELPRCPRSREELLREDLAPYRALAPAAAMVMVGHAHYPALDPAAPLPASGSPAVLRLLREELGYQGPCATDDLEMGAVGARDAGGAHAEAALAAGCDLLLYCHELGRAEEAAERLAARAAADPVFAARLREAAGRVEALARAWPARDASLAAWDAARAALTAAGGTA